MQFEICAGDFAKLMANEGFSFDGLNALYWHLKENALEAYDRFSVTSKYTEFTCATEALKQTALEDYRQILATIEDADGYTLGRSDLLKLELECLKFLKDETTVLETAAGVIIDTEF